MNDQQSIQGVESPSFFFALIGGLGASIVGAIIWAIVTVISQYQIGYMSIGLGVLVGFSVKYFGQQKSIPMALVGAGISLFGCLLGNLLSQVGFYAQANNMDIISVLLTLNPSAVVEIISAAFQPMDAFFYLLAIYCGFSFVYPINKKHAQEKDKQAKDQIPQGIIPETLPYPKHKKIMVLVVITVIALIVFSFINSANGIKLYYYPTGEKYYSGELEWNKSEGLWTYWYESGAILARVNFADNLEEGSATRYYENGNVYTKENYHRGMLHGEYRGYYENGKLSTTGNFQYNRRVGEWRTFYEEGTLETVGQYQLDLPEGLWRFYFPKGLLKQEGNYENGEFIDLWKEFDEKGKLLLETVYENKIERTMNYWLNGEQLVKDGTGEVSIYNDKGQVITRGMVLGGYREGIWKDWNEKGQLFAETRYEKGSPYLVNYWDRKGNQLVKEGTGVFKDYYETGELKTEISYIDGLSEGEYKFWNLDGTLLLIQNYKKGKLNGPQKSYSAQGSLILEGNFLNDKKHGLWKWYEEETGLIASQVEFINGKKQGLQEFWVSGTKIKDELYKDGVLVETKVY